MLLLRVISAYSLRVIRRRAVILQDITYLWGFSYVARKYESKSPFIWMWASEVCTRDGASEDTYLDSVQEEKKCFFD